MEKRRKSKIATAQPFAIRGALEGFYGTFYTFAQRDDLIRFLGQQGFNLYLYGPKNDRHHRRHWRKPYPVEHMAQFSQTVAVAQKAGLAFAYALSPGATISYHSAEEFALLTNKLRAFYEIGVRDFSLFLDDIAPQFSDAGDALRYANYAAAQADLCNRTYSWLQKLDRHCTLSMCPTDYHGSAPFSAYLHELGAHLDPQIGVFYTGPKICSTTIAAADAQAFGRAVRRPPLIWDNYPVNDLAMQCELHIGPIRGRDSSLHENIAGAMVNLMSQPEASKIPLHTYATYFRDPAGYEPESAWETALRQVAGEQSADALQRLGENSLRCCLRTPEAEPLTGLANAVLDGLNGASPDGAESAFQALETYLQQLDEACYHLNYYLPRPALRQDILPWTEGLHLQQEMGRHALEVLGADTPLHSAGPVRRLQELLEEVSTYPKRIGGEALLPLARAALRRVERLEHEPPLMPAAPEIAAGPGD